MRLFSDVSTSIEDPFLRRAHGLAVRGIGTTSPNPAVGCVIVSDGEVAGEGWHERAGGPHAEVVALEAAGPRARGATAYVTLEPCAHHGKTPPCAEALLAAGVTRVVIGMRDPHHQAAGGAEALRSAGVDVAFAPDPAPFEELNEGWLRELTTGLPWITVKVALSLDAKIARAEGVRTAISGPGGASLTMRLRSMADAVMVGARTVEIDDPALTVRDPDGALAARQPLRTILCGERIPVGATMLTDGAGPVVLLAPEALATAPEADTEATPFHAEMLSYDPAGGLRSAFRALARHGSRRVLVEPGGRLFTALLDGGLIDEVVLVHAGGFAGTSAPGIYTGEGEGTGSILGRGMAAREAAVIEGDAVTTWRRRVGVEGRRDERKG